MDAPTLLTPRLCLKMLGRDCALAYEAFYTDPLASAFYNGPLTPAAAWSRLASDIGVWRLQGFGVWAVHDQPSGAVLGVCGFWQGLGWPRELTWWLLPAARGQGIALEASRAVINHAYESFQWSVVQTYMNDHNAAAKALVARLNGVLTARQMFPDGLERDVFDIPVQPVK
jgi:[ribosomal protein S5]-alanine N-acetyltransferase